MAFILKKFHNLYFAAPTPAPRPAPTAAPRKPKYPSDISEERLGRALESETKK